MSNLTTDADRLWDSPAECLTGAQILPEAVPDHDRHMAQARRGAAL